MTAAKKAAKRAMQKKKGKRKKKRWDGAVGEWDDLPLNVSRGMLAAAARDYKCIVLHKDCFDPSFNKDATRLFARYNNNYFKTSTLTREEKLARVPDFSKLKVSTTALSSPTPSLTFSFFSMKEFRDEARAKRTPPLIVKSGIEIDPFPPLTSLA